MCDNSNKDNLEIYDIISLYEQTKREYKSLYDFIDRNQLLFNKIHNITKFIIYCYFGYFNIKESCDEEVKWNYISLILSDLFSFYNRHDECMKEEFVEFYKNNYDKQIKEFTYDFVLNTIITDAFCNLKL